MMKALRSFALATVLFAVIWSVAGAGATAQRHGAAGPLEQSYQSAWRDGPTTAITRALAPEHIGACATYKFKRNTTKPHERLVRCSRDGRTWRTYLVYTDSGTVIGPYEPAPAYD